MLDLAGLPKNSNGFRTTHTCELCGFEPKTKNKYREKQDHLVMKHFKERIDKIFPHCRPYTCPNTECEFAGKDKQALLRHYTGKHGVLELFLREALAAKGINYHLSDSAKRKSLGNTDKEHRSDTVKKARMSPGPQETLLPQGSPDSGPMLADTTTILPSEFPDLVREPVSFHQVASLGSQTRLPSLPTVPTTKLPSMSTVLSANTRLIPSKAEVDEMLASFNTFSTMLTQGSPHPSPSPPLDSTVSSTTLDFFLPTSEESTKLLLNDNIMWGTGSTSITSDSSGPAQYFENSEQGFVNLGDIDMITYDYLGPATLPETTTTIQPTQTAGNGGERLLCFNQL